MIDKTKYQKYPQWPLWTALSRWCQTSWICGPPWECTNGEGEGQSAAWGPSAAAARRCRLLSSVRAAGFPVLQQERHWNLQKGHCVRCSVKGFMAGNSRARRPNNGDKIKAASGSFSLSLLMGPTNLYLAEALMKQSTCRCLYTVFWRPTG